MRKLAITILRRLILLLAAGLVIVCFSFLQSQIHAASEAPEVDLNADNVGPRAIEELTSKTIARDYANAWKTMAEALDKLQQLRRQGPSPAAFTFRQPFDPPIAASITWGAPSDE